MCRWSCTRRWQPQERMPAHDRGGWLSAREKSCELSLLAAEDSRRWARPAAAHVVRASRKVPATSSRDLPSNLRAYGSYSLLVCPRRGCRDSHRTAVEQTILRG